MKHTALVLFLRVPEAGRVKTRLAKDLDQGLVLALYKAFVLDMIQVMADAQPESENRFLFFCPPEGKSVLQDWLGPAHILRAQQGNDLGERMAHAIVSLVGQGFRKVVLMGSDIPEIEPGLLEKAARILDRAGAVLGPCRDGGYYLIGFDAAVFDPSVFQHVAWSTPRALAMTADNLDRLGIRHDGLIELDDVDTLADLKALAGRTGNRLGSHTSGVLARISRAGIIRGETLEMPRRN